MNKIVVFCKKWWPTIVTFVIAIVATCVFIIWGHDEVLTGDGTQPINEIVRNYGLLIIAFWGAVLAVWRSQIAGEQADSASRQAETSERGFRNERYQKGADMLGSETLTTRMGGLYALELLARDHPEDYLDQIIKIIATFVRHPSQGEETHAPEQSGAGNPLPYRRDVLEAVWVISRLNEINVQHDKPNLSLADLSYMRFTSGSPTPKNFTNFDFTGAKLNHAEFPGANLTGANFLEANLTNARLVCANFTGADITFADIASANLMGAKGLTQAQINITCQNPDGASPILPNNFTWDKGNAIELWHHYRGDPNQD